MSSEGETDPGETYGSLQRWDAYIAIAAGLGLAVYALVVDPHVSVWLLAGLAILLGLFRLFVLPAEMKAVRWAARKGDERRGRRRG